MGLSSNGWRSAAVAAGLLALLSGCATTGNRDEVLQAAQATYAQANETPRIHQFAERNMEEAQQHLQRLSDADSPAALDHHSFMVQQQVAIAQARLQRDLMQEEIRQSDRQRQALLLEAEQRQVARSQEEATLAQRRAEQSETELAQVEMDLALTQERLEATRQQLQQAEQQAQALALELEELQVQAQERGTVFTLSDVVFDFDSDELNDGGRRTVERIAEAISQYPEGSILIEGYTDSVGNAGYNEALSGRRAEAVKNAFVAAGIETRRIRTVGHGQAYPVASNETPAGRQLNRRVEIVVDTDDDGNVARGGSRG